jgi:hypothetical protein
MKTSPMGKNTNVNTKEGYGTVIPIIYLNDDSGEFWQGDPEKAPNDYKPVGWLKSGERRLYVDKSAIELTSQNGMTKELQQSNTLSDTSTEADIKKELIEFIKKFVAESSALGLSKHREITFIELEQHLISRGYDPSGSHTYSESGSRAIYWKADKTFIRAVSQLIDENWLRMYSAKKYGGTLETYQEQASNLDRSIPVSHLPVAKRLGEYSYKNPHWGVVYFKPGRETAYLLREKRK